MKKKKKENDIILKHGAWIIKTIPHNIVLHHVNDKKMKNARYFSGIIKALNELHEQILLDKRLKNGYDASMESFKNAIIETNNEFEELLSSKTVERINKMLVVDGEEGRESKKRGG